MFCVTTTTLFSLLICHTSLDIRKKEKKKEKEELGDNSLSFNVGMFYCCFCSVECCCCSAGRSRPPSSSLSQLHLLLFEWLFCNEFAGELLNSTLQIARGMQQHCVERMHARACVFLLLLWTPLVQGRDVVLFAIRFVRHKSAPPPSPSAPSDPSSSLVFSYQLHFWQIDQCCFLRATFFRRRRKREAIEN